MTCSQMGEAGVMLYQLQLTGEDHRLIPSLFRHSFLLEHHAKASGIDITCGCSEQASRDLSSTPHPRRGLPLLASLTLLCIRNTPPWTTR